ncbi:MAG: alpha-L-fucosidase [Phycisphaerae bacterium]|nr:alpha-L-fucosidase [Phycisphaerae bacterium]
MIWFDTPLKISKQRSQELFDLVHQLQPTCLVNGRLGHGIGDYGQTEDNDIPSLAMENPFEVPVTMNDTWGYKTHDNNWKSSRVLIENLLDVISKGGNYLLNLGPDAKGNIPSESTQRTDAIGRWLKINGDAVFGTRPIPFPATFPWGHVTSKAKTLFLHITDPNTKRIDMRGLRNKITNAHLLDRKGIPLKYTQLTKQDHSITTLSVQIPQTCFYTSPFVVVLQLNEDISVDNMICQQADGNIILEACRGEVQSQSSDVDMKLGVHSSIQGWLSSQAKIQWAFRVHEPGFFKVSVLTAAKREDGDPASSMNWDGGHRIRISSGYRRISETVKKDFIKTDEGS